MKINELSKEQWDSLPKYIDKWIDTASNPVDFLKAKKAIIDVYKLSDKKEPDVLIANGPIDAFWSAVALQIICGDKEKLSMLGSTLYLTLGSTLSSTLDSTLGSTKYDDKVKATMQNAYDSLYISQYWSWWAGWYDFSESIGVPFDKENLNIFRDFCSEISLIYCFDKVAIICKKPIISWKAAAPKGNRILHCENGPAIKYEDGYEIYCLNNILVPKWVVMTDSGQIDPQKALTEKNVDIQREIIRKIGAERMLKACNAETLDTFTDKHTKGGNEYKLMRMKIGVIDRKYLYFEHASLPGVWYAQPVHPSITKALHARAWMLGIGEVEELNKKTDKEVLECLPVFVS